MEKNRFNLIEEPWIPVVGTGLVSLRDIFSNSEYIALGGNPIQKIAITKLLLAIAQSAYTPSDDNDWADMGATGLTEKCLAYLEQWRERFWLYGERPFLQMPAVIDLINARPSKTSKNLKTGDVDRASLPKPFGSGNYPDLPSDNTTQLFQCQLDQNLSDAEKALFIVTLMNFALGGKRVEKNLTNLSGVVYGSKHSAKPGPSLGNYVGYLHTFLMGDSIHTSLWMNLLTLEKINAIWPAGLGMAPWERMPATETCQDAENLKTSYMGCLVALSRFVYLSGEGIYYLEGIQYPSHKKGWREPSISVEENDKGVKLIWTDVNKKPWRELTSILAFIGSNIPSRFECQQIRFGFHRARKSHQAIAIWSGGLRVRVNSGDQSVKQDDDYVESLVKLPESSLDESWFNALQYEMLALDKLSKTVYSSTRSYFKTLNKDASRQAELASNMFWQLCNSQYQSLVNACGNDEHIKSMRQVFADFARDVYDHYCTKDTARQLDAWAKHRPNLSYYLLNNHKETEDNA